MFLFLHGSVRQWKSIDLISVSQVSDGGVHSHINHLFSMLEAAKQLDVPKCYVQFFGDGRDTRPISGGL